MDGFIVTNKQGVVAHAEREEGNWFYSYICSYVGYTWRTELSCWLWQKWSANESKVEDSRIENERRGRTRLIDGYRTIFRGGKELMARKGKEEDTCCVKGDTHKEVMEEEWFYSIPGRKRRIHGRVDRYLIAP